MRLGGAGKASPCSSLLVSIHLFVLEASNSLAPLPLKSLILPVRGNVSWFPRAPPPALFSLATPSPPDGPAAHLGSGGGAWAAVGRKRRAGERRAGGEAVQGRCAPLGVSKERRGGGGKHRRGGSWEPQENSGGARPGSWRLFPWGAKTGSGRFGRAESGRGRGGSRTG